MYHCTKCFWYGNQLGYGLLGQGHCPECNAVFRGCVSNTEYDRQMGKKSIATFGLSLLHRVYPIWVQLNKVMRYYADKERRQCEYD